MTHNTTRQARWIAAFFTLGLIFSQWHVIAYYRITGNLLTHGIPSLGLVFIMLAAPFAASLRFPRHIKTA